jgi:hypothetical protein
MARFHTGSKAGRLEISLVFGLALGALVATAGAETIEIGDGDELIEFVEAQPLIDQARELHIQIVYLAGEIGMAGEISALEFQARAGTDMRGTEWTIRMKHTDMPGFRKRWGSDRGRWTKVYQGRLPEGPPAPRLGFEFDRSFEYDGVRNVLLEIVIEDIPPGGNVPLVCFHTPWPRTAHRIVGLLPSLPTSGDPRELAGNYRLSRWIPNTMLELEPALDPAPLAAGFPFREGFESGTLAAYWDESRHAYVGEPEASTIAVTPQCGPHEGSYHLRMTVTGSGDSYVSAAILTIDLSDEDNVVLHFWHKWFDYLQYRQGPADVGLSLPSVTPLNGVAISEDGEDWVAVAGLRPVITAEGYRSYAQYFVDLDQAAEEAEMTFNSHFRIKFQYGLTHFACLPPSGSGGGCSHPCNLDPGVAFDDIVIEAGNPPPTVSDIDPSSGDNDATVPIMGVYGSGFIHGAEVRLTRAGQEDIIAEDCEVLGSGRIRCEIPLDGAAIGLWDVVVTNTLDAQSGTLASVFEVTDASIETVTIGDLEDQVSDQHPMGTGFYCQRQQAIYRAEEINLAGPIIEIALYVDRPPRHDLTGWTVRMKHTDLETYPEDIAWEPGGWTVCHQSTLERGRRGWTVIPLLTPFDYDGVRNLMIDFSFNNDEKSYHGHVWASLPGETLSIGLGESFAACAEHPAQWVGDEPQPDRQATRPDVRLTFVRE